MMDEHDDRRKRLTPEQRKLLAKRMRAKAEAENRTVPLKGGEADGIRPLPMSFAEERFWLLETLERGNPAHHIVGRTRLAGPLKIAVLKAALSEVTQRFEILRTSYAVEAGHPRPSLVADDCSSLAIEDVSDGDDLRHQQIIREVGTEAFELSLAPLWRVRLLILGEELHDLVFAFHHIIADGLALQLFARALQEAYQAQVGSGGQAMVSPNPESLQAGPSYRDYAQWQRSELSGRMMKDGLQWWERRLSDAPALELPTDHPRHDGTQSKGARYSLPVDAKLLGQVRELAKAQGLTPHAILLTALKFLLSRIGDAPDLSIGIPVAGRDQPGTENILGFFVNSLVVRSEIDPASTFADGLAEVRAQIKEARAHEHVPFEAIVKHLNPERVANRNPLFQVMFNYVDFGEYKARIGEVEATYFSEPLGTLFDLTLYAHVTEAGLRLEWEYDAALFDESTVGRWLRWLSELLALMTQDADLCFAAWTPTESETDRRLARKATDGGEALGVMLPQGLAKAVGKACTEHADSLAVVQATEALSFAELWKRSHQIADALLKLNLDEDARIGIALPRSPDMIATILACLRLGRTWVPLDLKYPEDRWHFMAKDAQLGAWVVTRGKWERWQGPELEFPSLNVQEIDPLAVPDDLPRIERIPQRIAYLIYTSGSTGQPKGVEVPLSALEAFLEAMLRAPGCDAGATWLSVTTLSFDISLLEIFLPLLTGARIILADDDQVRDGGALIRLIAKHSATIMQATPSTWRLLLLAGWKGQSSLRALCGGEALSQDLLSDLQSRTQEVWNLYGPTETTIWSTRANLSTAVAVHIGHPIEGTQLHIVDQELEPVPMGLWGELLISGAGLAAGYYNARELTAQQFIRLPSGERAYRTGDRARIRCDGTIECGGRLDRQIKLRGHRLEPGEIEVRLRTHPDVQDVVVDVVHDGPTAHLSAWVIPGEIELKWDALGTRLGNWCRVWENAYESEEDDDEASSSSSDAALDITGWINPITGEPESPEIMAEWASETLERLRRPALHPRGIENSKVFEVGCGTGMLLLGLAPEVAHYVACDPAEARLQQLEAEVERRGLSEKVELKEGHAGFIGPLSGGEKAQGSYDLVIVNSVAQYLPDSRALVTLVEDAAQLLRPGGTLWIGDLRSKSLLPLHHAWHLLYGLKTDPTSSGGLSGTELSKSIALQVEQESELCADPQFLYACLEAEDSPWATARAELKAASGIHELALFRFDATLCRASNEGPNSDRDAYEFFDPHPVSPRHVDAADLPSRIEWQGLLEEHGAVLIVGVPDPRQLPLREWLEETTASTDTLDTHQRRFWTALSAAETAAETSNHSPRAFHQWAAAADCHIRTFWSQEQEGHFDVLLTEKALRARSPSVVSPQRDKLNSALLEPLDYLNRPEWREAWQQLQSELRIELTKQVPDVMVPTRWVQLNAFPKTPNGKLDRRALIQLASENSGSVVESSAWKPTTPAEKQVLEIWTEVMGREPQASTDFFRAGGHSLLAAQLVARLSEVSGITVPLRDFFANPTPMGLAHALSGSDHDGAKPPAKASSLTPRPAGMDTVPMSRAQRRLYFISDHTYHSDAYLMRSSVWIEGEISEAEVSGAFSALVARHESLRTVFGLEDGVPIQQVLSALPDDYNVRNEGAHYSVEDLSEWVTKHIDDTHRFGKRPAWDLRWGSLIDEDRYSEDSVPHTHCFVFCIHHMLADAASLQTLWQEFFDLLGGEVLPEDLPPIALQPADLAWHESEGRFEEAQAEALRWWIEHLEGTTLAWELPSDRLREANRTRGDAGGMIRYEVDPGFVRDIVGLARELRTTPFVVQLAAFAVFLHRMGAPEDFLIGTAAARRGGSATQRTVGFLVSTLPLRMQLQRDESFESLVRGVHNEVMGALDSGDLAFEELVQEFNQEHSIAQSPLFPVTFDLVELPAEGMEVASGQLLVTPGELPPPAPKFDLSLRFELRGEAQWLCLEWDAALFDEGSMRAFEESYMDLLGDCVDHPKAKPFSVDLKSDPRDLDERYRPSQLVFDASPSTGSKLSLIDRLATRARERRDAPAFVAERVVLYDAWWEQVTAATDLLISSGLRPGDRVALCGPRSATLAAWIVAIWNCEGIWVALDENLPPVRIEKILQRTGPALFVVDPHVLSGSMAELCAAHGAIAWDAWPESATADGSTIELDTDSERAAGYIIHTSGSSGEPKGVHVALHALEHYLGWAEQLYLPGTSSETEGSEAVASTSFVPWHGSLASDLGLTGWLLPLVAGGEVHVLPEDASNPLKALSVGSDRPYSFVKLTPSHLRGLRYAISEARRPLWAEQLIVGGEALRYDDVRPWSDCGLRVFNEYGPTEAAIGCAVWEVRQEDIKFLSETLPGRVRRGEYFDKEPLPLVHAVPIGVSAPGIEFLVCEQNGAEVPVGAVGELWIGGPQLALGYWQAPPLTAEQFVEREAEDGVRTRWYRTGDLVRYGGNGALMFLGRDDNQVKIRGHRIELGEIEAELLRHESVHHVHVAAEPSSDHSGVQLQAYILSEPAHELDAHLLQGHLLHRLPSASIPQRWIAVSAWPLSDSGKLDVEAMRALVIRETSGSLAERAPETENEKLVALVLEEVLGVPVRSTSDDFFALGGDSIKALMLEEAFSRVQKTVSVEALFTLRTVGALALALESTDDQKGPWINSYEPPKGRLPLLPAQRWFFSHRMPQWHHWNQMAAASVSAHFPAAEIESAWQGIISVHPMLTARFFEEDGHWWMEALDAVPESPSAFVIIEGQPGESKAAWSERRRRSIAKAQGGLNPEQGQLAAAVLSRFHGENVWEFKAVVHHLAVDAVSWHKILSRVTVWLSRDERAFGESEALQHASTLQAMPLLDRADASHAGFPTDYPEAANLEASTTCLTQVLDKGVLTSWSEGTPEYRRQRGLESYLLSVWVRVLQEHAGARVGILVENRGRTNTDPSPRRRYPVGGIGWYTGFGSIDLPFTEDTEPDWASFVSTAEIALRSIREAEAAAMPLSVRPFEHPAAFNFLGNVGDPEPEGRDANVQPLLPSRVGTRGPKNPRTHLVEVDIYIFEGRLYLEWSFGDRIDQATVLKWQRRFNELLDEALREVALSSGRRTPSDYPLVDLNQVAVDSLTQHHQIDVIHPLTPTQLGMVFHERLHPGSGAYFEQRVALFGGDPFQREEYRDALQKVMAKVPLLRSDVIFLSGQEPLMRVYETDELALPFSCEEFDESDIDDAKAYAKLEAYALEDRQQPFQIEEGPLWRAHVIEFAGNRWGLVLSHHHVLFDGWSLPTLLLEVARNYELAKTGHLGGGFSFFTPFHEYVGELRKPVSEDGKAFFREELAGIGQATRIGNGQASPDAHAHLELGRAFGERESARLSEAAAQVGMTLGVLVQAAWGVALSQAAGASEVLFGLTVSGRSNLGYGAGGSMGMFINTVPVTLRFDDANITAKDWLAEVQTRNLQRLKFENTPLTVVQGLGEIPAGQPLFHSVLVFENYPIDVEVDSLREGESNVHLLRSGGFERTHYPATLVVIPGDRLTLRLLYDPRVLEGESGPQLLAAFEDALQSLAQGMDRPLSEVQLLSSSARKQLWSWGCGPRLEDKRWQGESAVRRILARAQSTPEAIAIEAAFEDQSNVSFGDLQQQMLRITGGLEAAGVRAGTIVPWIWDRTPSSLTAMLGVAALGAKFFPLDPQWPDERIRDAILRVGSRLVVASEAVQGRVQEVLGASVDAVLVAETLVNSSEHGWSLEQVAAQDHSAGGYCMMTSGSTGEPRIVEVGESSLRWFSAMAQEVYGYSPKDRVLQFAQPSFDTFIEETWPVLAAGGCVQLRREEDIGTLSGFLKRVVERGTTVLDLPTAYWHLWMESWPSEFEIDQTKLRLLILGGEAVSAKALSVWKARAGEQCTLLNTYGPTEATVVCAAADLSNWTPQSSVPIGKALPEVELLVLDSQGRLAMPGADGQLAIAGPGVAEGYFGDAAATEKRFVAHPMKPDERCHLTGDRVRFAMDGTLYYLGRIDRQFKLRGIRIDPSEVEAALQVVPGIHSAYVTCLGHGASARIAAWVLSEEQGFDGGELKRIAAQRLPEVARPSSVNVVEAWPLNSSGKIDGRALVEEQSQSAVHTPEESEAEESSSEDSASVRQLCVLFEQAFSGAGEGEAAEEVSGLRVRPDDGFFELGGHSLIAVRLAALIENAFDRELPLAWMFEGPSPRQLAQWLEGEVKPPVAVRPESLFEEAVKLPSHWPLHQLITEGSDSDAVQNVLLTGATGYFGGHLLHALLKRSIPKITVVVRADDLQAAEARIRNVLGKDLEHEIGARIAVVVGDLGQAEPGLPSEIFEELSLSIDTIIHCAASTEFGRSFDHLAPMNIEGTKQMVLLALQGRTKALHHVSTIGVFDRPQVSDEPWDERTAISSISEIRGAYAQSKACAERVALTARKRGVPVSIYRPGRLVGSAITPGDAPSSTLMGRIAAASQAINAVPDLSFDFDLSPVSWAAEAMTALIMDPASLGKAHHLINPVPLSLRKVVEGFPALSKMEVLSPPEFMKRLDQGLAKDDPLRLLLGSFEAAMDPTVPAPKVTHDLTTERLTRLEAPMARESFGAIARWFSQLIAPSPPKQPSEA